MADQRLVDYIRDNMQGGYSEDQLIHLLLGQGWEVREINEALDTVHGTPSPPPAPVPRQKQLPEQGAAKPAYASRTLWITLICLFGVIANIMALIGGVLMLFSGTVLTDASASGVFGRNETNSLFNQWGTASILFAIPTLILSLLALVGFYLLWEMKRKGVLIVIVTAIANLLNTFLYYYFINLNPFNIFLFGSLAFWSAVIAYLLAKRKLFV